MIFTKDQVELCGLLKIKKALQRAPFFYLEITQEAL